MSYPLKKILTSLPPGPRPPIFIGVAEPLTGPNQIENSREQTESESRTNRERTESEPNRDDRL